MLFLAALYKDMGRNNKIIIYRGPRGQKANLVIQYNCTFILTSCTEKMLYQAHYLTLAIKASVQVGFIYFVFVIVFIGVIREHDKGPELFFHALYQLAEQGLDFKVSVLGETFSEAPGICVTIVHYTQSISVGEHTCMTQSL